MTCKIQSDIYCFGSLLKLVFLTMFCFAISGFSQTREDIVRISQRASSSKKEVARRETALANLKEKLELANQNVTKIDHELILKRTEVPRSEKAVKKVEKDLDIAENRVQKISSRIKKYEQRLIKSRERAQHFSNLETELRNRYIRNTVRKTHKTQLAQLNRYEARVKKLENKVRAAQAEVTARTIIAGRTTGQWKRKFANFKVYEAKDKADYLLNELRIYQGKVSKAQNDIVGLKAKLKKAQSDYPQYEQEMTKSDK